MFPVELPTPRRMAIAIAALISAMLTIHPAGAQIMSRSYEVTTGDKRVGEVRASMRKVGDEVHYEVRSEVTVSMLFKVHVSYKVKAVFRDGIMQGSSATVYLNGSVRSQVDAVLRGEVYDFVVDGELRHHRGLIYKSAATLYFTQPDVGQVVFSETSGALKPLCSLSDGRMMLRSPQKASDVNMYRYSSNDLLKTIEIEHALFPTLVINHVASL